MNSSIFNQAVGKHKNVSIFKWNPTEDRIWVFKTNYVDRIKTSALVSTFCDQFSEEIDDNEEVVICPIGLYCDGSLGKKNGGEVIHIMTLESLGKVCKFKSPCPEDEWLDKAHMDELQKSFNKSLNNVVNAYSGEEGIEGSVIFRVKGMKLHDVRKIENLLQSLNYCVIWDTGCQVTHFEVSGEPVTVFEYESECG